MVQPIGHTRFSGINSIHLYGLVEQHAPTFHGAWQLQFTVI